MSLPCLDGIAVSRLGQAPREALPEGATSEVGGTKRAGSSEAKGECPERGGNLCRTLLP